MRVMIFSINNSQRRYQSFLIPCPRISVSVRADNPYKGQDVLIYGGCQPTLTHLRRAARITELFIFKAIIVAHPTAVSPVMYAPDSSQAKCSFQFCLRGWKSGSISLVSGSFAVVWLPLNSLQLRHARQRFSKVVGPPRDPGIIWSIVIDCPVFCSEV